MYPVEGLQFTKTREKHKSMEPFERWRAAGRDTNPTAVTVQVDPEIGEHSLIPIPNIGQDIIDPSTVMNRQGYMTQIGDEELAIIPTKVKKAYQNFNMDIRNQPYMGTELKSNNDQAQIRREQLVSIKENIESGYAQAQANELALLGAYFMDERVLLSMGSRYEGYYDKESEHRQKDTRNTDRPVLVLTDTLRTRVSGKEESVWDPESQLILIPTTNWERAKKEYEKQLSNAERDNITREETMEINARLELVEAILQRWDEIGRIRNLYKEYVARNNEAMSVIIEWWAILRDYGHVGRLTKKIVENPKYQRLQRHQRTFKTIRDMSEYLEDRNVKRAYDEEKILEDKISTSKVFRKSLRNIRQQIVDSIIAKHIIKVPKETRYSPTKTQTRNISSISYSPDTQGVEINREDEYQNFSEESEHSEEEELKIDLSNPAVRLKLTTEEIRRLNLDRVNLTIIISEMIEKMRACLKSRIPCNTEDLSWKNVQKVMLHIYNVVKGEIDRLRRRISDDPKATELEDEWASRISDYASVVAHYKTMVEEQYGQKNIHTFDTIPIQMGMRPREWTTTARIETSGSRQVWNNTGLNWNATPIMIQQSERGTSQGSNRWNQQAVSTPSNPFGVSNPNQSQQQFSGQYRAPILPQRSYSGQKGQTVGSVLQHIIPKTPEEKEQEYYSMRERAREETNQYRLNNIRMGESFYEELTLEDIPLPMSEAQQISCQLEYLRKQPEYVEQLGNLLNITDSDRKREGGTTGFFPLMAGSGNSQLNNVRDDYRIGTVGLRGPEQFSTRGLRMRHDRYINSGQCISLIHGRFIDKNRDVSEDLGYEVQVGIYAEPNRPLKRTSTTEILLSKAHIGAYILDPCNLYSERAAGKNKKIIFSEQELDPKYYEKVQPNVSLQEVYMVIQKATKKKKGKVIKYSEDPSEVREYADNQKYRIVVLPALRAIERIGPCEFLFWQYSHFVEGARQRLSVSAEKRMRQFNMQEHLREFFMRCNSVVRINGNLSYQEAQMLEELTKVLMEHYESNTLLDEPKRGQTYSKMVRGSEYRQLVMFMGISYEALQYTRDQMESSNRGTLVGDSGIANIITRTLEMHAETAGILDKRNNSSGSYQSSHIEDWDDDDDDSGSESESDDSTEDETELNSNESTSESDTGSETDDSSGAGTSHNSKHKKDRNRDKDTDSKHTSSKSGRDKETPKTSKGKTRYHRVKIKENKIQ